MSAQEEGGGLARWNRRNFLAAGAAGAAFWASAARAAPSSQRSILFDIYRDGKPIGVHEVRFEPRPDGGFDAVTSVDVRIKLGFITLYYFTQQLREKWLDGLMVGAECVTDDDGELARVEAKLEEGVLKIDGPAGLQKAPAGLLTDVSFWNPVIARKNQVVDTWLGTVAPLFVKGAFREEIRVGDQRVKTERFSLTANRGRSGEVWYDGEGNWVRAHLITPNAELDYLLRV